MKKTAILILLFLSASSVKAQVQKAKLPRNINVPTKSHIYPSLTSDEKYMLFYTNYSNTGNYELKYTKKTGRSSWSDPEYVENILKRHNDHFTSFSVSPNGKYLLFSSYRAGGIGNYDILISERSGDQWSQPKNPGKPLNSPGNEGNPSLSPDGRSIYFMRCETMDANEKSGCKILVSHKRSKNIWGEPEELPSYINTGHSTSPRILADNETLIFSSERPGNKGKLDLYMTRLENGVWSQPVPLDIINTVKNDEFVSVPARGDVIYYTDVSNDQFIIAMALLPQELRPKKVILLSGKINNAQSTDKINIQAYDAHSGQLVTAVNLEEGESEFDIILPEGHVYDFSIFPTDARHNYYSQVYDLNMLESSDIDYLDFTVEPLQIGKSYYLPAILFDTIYQQVKDISATEFRRISALMQKNPNLNFEFRVYTSKPVEKEMVLVEVQDTLLSADSNLAEYPQPDYSDTYEEESETVESFEELDNSAFVDLEDDSPEMEEESFEFETDHTDTSQAALENSFYAPKKVFEEKIIFDPLISTQEYAESIKNYLVQKGAPASRITVVGGGNLYSQDRSDETRKYWVEMRLSY